MPRSSHYTELCLRCCKKGTYVRTSAIDTLVLRFLRGEPSKWKQVVSLGAGSDTRFFRLAASESSMLCRYHEFDFAENAALKISAIQKAPGLQSTIRSTLPPGQELVIDTDGNSISSATYNVHPLDLRTLTKDAQDSNPLPIPNLSPDLPTLILSECCLCYLPPAAADDVLQTFATRLVPAPTALAVIIYEPIRPNDPFGRVMISNLATRGIVLQTLKKYSSLSRQIERMRVVGFDSGRAAADIDFIWEKWISDKEKTRIAALEMIDEIEEWRLLAKHYCVAWGWRTERQGDSDVFGKAWMDTEGQNDHDAGFSSD
jgi:[phosphatase 2A protein]-leucine-carboxy methyltransferase